MVNVDSLKAKRVIDQTCTAQRLQVLNQLIEFARKNSRIQHQAGRSIAHTEF